MQSTVSRSDPYADPAVLAAAESLRAAGFSWRQVEAQLRSAGVRVTYVTLRAKLAARGSSPSLPITRGRLLRFLAPLAADRRAAGLTWDAVSRELNAAGLRVSTASLKSAARLSSTVSSTTADALSLEAAHA